MIAAYKRPRDPHFIDTLPKLPNGKVEKFKLRAPLQAVQSEEQGSRA
jgi:acyl-coenzyme A synthetase/AMP-(fatty) acid ligase